LGFYYPNEETGHYADRPVTGEEVFIVLKNPGTPA
jgi:hypothetical protein